MLFRSKQESTVLTKIKEHNVAVVIAKKDTSSDNTAPQKEETEVKDMSDSDEMVEINVDLITDVTEPTDEDIASVAEDEEDLLDSTDENFEDDKESSAELDAIDLLETTRNYQLAQEKQRELKSTIALIYKELEGININKESIDAAFPDWRNAPAATQEIEIKDLGIAWNNLNTQASGLKQSISSTAEQMARLQKDLTGFYAANPTLDEERITVLSAWSGSRIEALRASLQTLKEEEVAASTAFHLATGQVEEHIGRKPEIEENENLETLDALIANLEEKITAGNQSIGQQKLRLEENTRNIDRIKEEKEHTDQLREEYLKWEIGRAHV